MTCSPCVQIGDLKGKSSTVAVFVRHQIPDLIVNTDAESALDVGLCHTVTQHALTNFDIVSLQQLLHDNKHDVQIVDS